MTFQQAKQELFVLADGRFHSIEYELTRFTQGKAEPKCTVYVDGIGHCSGITWRAALDELKIKLDRFHHDPKEEPTEEG